MNVYFIMIVILLAVSSKLIHIVSTFINVIIIIITIITITN